MELEENKILSEDKLIHIGDVDLDMGAVKVPGFKTVHKIQNSK